MSQNVASSRNWRKTEESTKGSRYTALALMFLMLVGLIIFFIYYFWPRSEPRPGFVWLEVPGYNTDLNGIPFAGEELGRINESVLPFDGNRLESGELRNSGELTKLPATLRGLFKDSRDKDIAIVCVTAQGISQADAGSGGEIEASAYLLGGDFEFDSPASRIPIDVLMKAMGDINSNTKLLLLDTAYYATDVRYGMAVNEFPFLLEQAVKDSDDPDLWVIHSTSLLQPAHVAYGGETPGSIFAKAVRGAFYELGDNSMGEDGEGIDLMTFYRRVTQWVWTYAPRNSEFAQTPVLMRGGVGFVDTGASGKDVKAANDVVVFYRVLEPKKEEKDDKEGDAKGDDGGDDSAAYQPSRSMLQHANEATSLLAARLFPSASSLLAPLTAELRLSPGAGRHGSLRTVFDPARLLQDEENSDDGEQDDTDENASDEEASDDTDGQGDGSDEEVISPPPTPEEEAAQRVAQYEEALDEGRLNELRQEMNQIHLLVDRLNARQNAHRWSPVDFAPDHWNRQLLRIARLNERAVYAKQGSEGYQLRLAEAKRIRQQLTDLQNRITNSQPGSLSNAEEQGDVGLKILDAWYQLVQSRAHLRWQPNDSDEADVIRSIRTYHDVLFRAKLYVQLNEALSPAIRTSLAGDVRRLIDSVHAQRDLFEQAKFGNPDNGFVDSQDELRRAAQDLVQDELRTFLSLESILTKVTELEKNGSFVIAQRVLVLMLESPLLPMLGPSGEDRDSRRLAPISRVAISQRLEQLLKENDPQVGSYDPNLQLPSEADFFGGSEHWTRVKERLQLRLALLRLASSEDSDLEKAIEEADKAISDCETNSINRESISDVLKSFRIANQRLNEAYEVAIEEGERLKNRNEPTFAARRMASVTDPRDPDLFSINQPNLARLEFVHPRAIERMRFQNTSQTLAMDQRKGSIELPLEVSGYTRSSLDIEVVAMQSTAFTIMYQGRELRNGEPFPVDVLNDEVNTIRLDVTANVDRANPPPTSEYNPDLPYLELRTHGIREGADQDATETRVYVVAPLPQFVDVIARHQGTGAWEPSSPNGQSDPDRGDAFPYKQPIECVKMRSYSARDSLFDLYLVNRSGVDITAKVDLFVVERPILGEIDGFPMALLPGRVSSGIGNIPYEPLADFMMRRISGRTGTALDPIASTLEFQVAKSSEPFPNMEQTFGSEPGTGQAVPIEFGVPLPEDAPEGTAGPILPPETPIDVSNGLLARISIEGWDEPVVQYRWIEFETVMPAEYLDVANLDRPAMVFDEAADEIQLSLYPSLGRKFPAETNYPWEFLEEISLVWDEKDPKVFPREYKLDGVLNVETRNAIASWKIGTDEYVDDLWRMGINVDGYPRALLFDIGVRGDDDNGRYVRNDAGELRDDVRVHRIVGIIGEGEEAQEFVVNDDSLIVNGAGWIPACERIRIEYRIDGPLGELSRLFPERLPSDEQFIEFSIDSGNKNYFKRRVFFDRDIQTTLEFEKQKFKVRADVSDLAVELAMDDLRMSPNVPVNVFGELHIEGDVKEAKRAFGIDRSPPSLLKISSDPDDRRVVVGKKDSFSIIVEARDEQSGILASGVEFYMDPAIGADNKSYDYSTAQGDIHTLQARPGGAPGTWMIVLAGENLGVGDHTIVPRIRDNVGLEAEVELDQVINVTVSAADTVVGTTDVGDPDGGDPDGADEVFVDVRVKLTINNNVAVTNPKGWKINDEDAFPEKIDDDRGHIFVFRGLAEGEHKIEASYTTILGDEATGSVTVKITGEEGEFTRRSIQLDTD